MPASAFVEQEVLEVYLAEKTPTKPKKLWIALCEEEPTRDADSQTIKEAGKGKELSYTNYARIELPVEAASGTFEFTAGSAGAIAKAVNKALIAYKLNTGADANDNSVWWALVDKAKNTEAGKMFFYGKWTAALKVQPTLTTVETEAKKLEVNCE